MDVREKLIEMISDFVIHVPHEEGKTWEEACADNLLAHGVTVQEWIPVTERLPEKREDVLLCRKWWNEIRNPQMGWYNEVSQCWFDLSNRKIHNVTNWMPLPKTPEGE